MSELDIDALLTKFLAGEATPEEAMLVIDWKEKSVENTAYYNSVEAAWMIANRSERSSNKEQTWERIRQNTAGKSKRVSFFTPLKIAASLLIILIAGFVIYRFSPQPIPADQWITKVSREEIYNLSLLEGTKVTLSGNSRISFPKEFKGNTRSVKLSGEAFFDVAHLPDQPFEIVGDELNIKVLGTAFNVSNLSGSSTVVTQVVRGKVMMYTSESSIIVEAGWTGRYDKQTKKLMLEKSASANALGYATHTFSFEASSMKEVAEYLSQSYGVTFVFENEKIKECRLTSSYENKPLSFILNVISESLGIDYQIKGNKVYISGDGCL